MTLIAVKVLMEPNPTLVGATPVQVSGNLIILATAARKQNSWVAWRVLINFCVLPC